MRESAFVDPPWLIDRRGEGYVQVTELLHRIAEVLDGQHTLEQIAEHASETTGRSVTADNVRQLVYAQFIKKGLVAGADGQLAESGAGRHRSLLQLNMRVRAVEGRTIDPLVRVLSWFFWPPVLVLALAVGVAFECWLYFVHGVAAGIHDALYAPGLLLILFAATIVAAAFHELGHAAALRYGGGMPRGMGAGLYIVYPAFYTDVSDNYRLGRWARVRTDLGGFYFNLVFGLGVFGVYLLTGHEVLLLIVSFLNLEMMRQLMPFLRLDGYWLPARPAATSPGAPPQTFSGQASYVPIDATERGSVADMVANTVATTEPRPTTNATPTVLPTLLPTPSSAAALVDASPTAPATALPTPASRPAALVTTSPTPARAVSPVPRTTPTATPLP